MKQVTLDQVLALNRELAALAEAGVPVGLGTRPSTVEALLDKANSSLALGAGRGRTLPEAVSQLGALPDSYRSALEAGVLSGNLTTVLQGVSRQSTANDELRRTVELSLVQPLVLMTLAYAGFYVLCLRFSPTLESFYDQLGQAPSTGVVFLRAARNWLPVWGPLVPALALGLVMYWRRSACGARSWLPWTTRYRATVAHATFAEQLANLLDHEVALPEALELAAGVTDDPAIMASAGDLAAAQRQSEALAENDSRLRPLPPLLRWSLTGDLGDQSLPDMLRFAAQTYRQSSDRQAAIWRVALPTVIGTVVGGAIVLAFGFAMFGPLARLFQDLAR